MASPPAGPERPDLLVRRLPARETDLLAAFLRGDAGTNAFLLGWLQTHGVEDGGEGRFRYVGVFSRDGLLRGHPEAIALVAGDDICCLSTGAPSAADALGRHLAEQRSRLRTVAGPTAMVDRAMTHAIGCSDAPVALRQRVYVLRAADFAPRSAPTLRLATNADIPALTSAGLDMHAEEVGAPLSSRRAETFRRAVSIKVERHRSWVLRDPFTDELVFKASVSAACREVAQVEGVWVAPAHRRRGVGVACMGELCARLLQSHNRVALYVGLENTAARDLYRRLGFRASTPFSSVLYDTTAT